ncbi:hypothetical protein C1H46_029981 [Malus baccata]|uniref:Uncharacterized protein n=1 Tax=Malus baccata TaxID=106549 RepID=A0A540LDF2_MALBA|nr:hypothetical protein C1H46_029981 [Malus baccata]
MESRVVGNGRIDTEYRRRVVNRRFQVGPMIRFSQFGKVYLSLISFVYIGSFSLAKQYRDTSTHQHIPYSLPWQGVSASTGNARNDEEFERICEIKESTSIERCRAINHVSLYACFLASGYRSDFKYDWVLGQTRLLQSLKTLAGGEEDRLFHSLITGVEEGAYYIA